MGCTGQTVQRQPGVPTRNLVRPSCKGCTTSVAKSPSRRIVAARGRFCQASLVFCRLNCARVRGLKGARAFRVLGGSSFFEDGRPGGRERRPAPGLGSPGPGGARGDPLVPGGPGGSLGPGPAGGSPRGLAGKLSGTGSAVGGRPTRGRASGLVRRPPAVLRPPGPVRGGREGLSGQPGHHSDSRLRAGLPEPCSGQIWVARDRPCNDNLECRRGTSSGRLARAARQAWRKALRGASSQREAAFVKQVLFFAAWTARGCGG
jgi:hypothetical protein